MDTQESLALFYLEWLCQHSDQTLYANPDIRLNLKLAKWSEWKSFQPTVELRTDGTHYTCVLRVPRMDDIPDRNAIYLLTDEEAAELVCEILRYGPFFDSAGHELTVTATYVLRSSFLSTTQTYRLDQGEWERV